MRIRSLMALVTHLNMVNQHNMWDPMANPLKVVAVSGSPQLPSRTSALVEHLVELIGGAVEVRTHLIEPGVIGPRLAGAVMRNQLPADIEAEIAAVESADLLVVASPV